MEAAIKSNVDYAVQAKTALAAIERLSDAFDKTLEKWRDYGAALLGQRQQMPSDQRFGQWVKEHGLDQGLAADKGVRADAMWFSEHFASVQRLYTGDSHHPGRIRQACRDAGFEWAGETKHQTERKSKSRRTKVRTNPYSWQKVAGEEGVHVANSGGRRTTIKAALAEIDSNPDLFSAANEQRLREVLVIWRTQQQPDSVIQTITEARESVPETARERFDKAVSKATAALEGAYASKMDHLQKSYEQEVSKRIEARIGPELESERKRARDMAERNRRMMQNFSVRRDGIKQAMNKKEFQLVLNCLHPDRAPDDRKLKYAEAFRIVKALQPYIDSFE